MRPYIAIIRDSFHAAFASRILWIVLLAIVVFLIALAPIGYQEVFTVNFVRDDINANSRLTGLLGKALQSETERADKRIVMALPEELRGKIEKSIEKDEERPRNDEYVDAFNNLLKDQSWYDKDLWQKTQRLRELRELDEQSDDQLGERLSMRRARLRIEAALPGAFRSRPERSILIKYAYLETPFEIPLRKEQFAEFLNQFAYPLILNILMGVGAVFIGILVTSPIIPDMFQPGSLHLLLSKPVSRPALYLAKFIGGCAFVLLCVSLLVAGLWLISGTRLGIWNHRLFLTIPVFILLFAVYYSVSAFAGLLWRTAVVSVAITVVFWFLCFIVGTSANIFEGIVAERARVNEILPGQDDLLLSTIPGLIYRVDASRGAKTEIFSTPFGQPPRSLLPTQLADQRVVIVNTGSDGFGRFSGDQTLLIFSPEEDWKQVPGLKLPINTSELIATSDGGLLSVSTNGVFYAAADKLAVDPDAEDKPNPASGLFGGFQRLLGGTTDDFENVLPETLALSTPADVELVKETDALIVYSGGKLYRLERQPGMRQRTVAAEVEVEGDSALSVHLAATPKHVIVARRREPLQIFNSDDLTLLKQLELDDTYSIVKLEADRAGKYALALLSDKSVWRIDLGEDPTLAQAAIPYQSNIETFNWDADNHLWLAHHIDQLTMLQPDTSAVAKTVRPERDIWRNIYEWVITPLRVVTPQTGEVGEIVIATVCGRSNVEVMIDQQVEREELSVVRPLATCGGFIAFMLMLGCLYVYRQDF